MICFPDHIIIPLLSCQPNGLKKLKEIEFKTELYDDANYKLTSDAVTLKP